MAIFETVTGPDFNIASCAMRSRRRDTKELPMKIITPFPYIGSGIGYRREIAGALLAAKDRIDVVELLVDQFIYSPDRLVEAMKICETLPTVPHGVGLSIGSAAGPDLDYLTQIKQISDICSAQYYSEHLCMTSAPAIDIGYLAPLMFTEESLNRTVENVHMVQEFLDVPLVLENITSLFTIPGATLSEAEFFAELVKRTDCGILLDLTNVHINAQNHGVPESDFIDALPLPSVIQVHLAGGYWRDGVFLDGHSEPVHEAVWTMFANLCSKASIRTCILEHDANFPADVNVLLEQVERARSIQQNTGPK